jgi:hypothetical protein
MHSSQLDSPLNIMISQKDNLFLLPGDKHLTSVEIVKNNAYTIFPAPF